MTEDSEVWSTLNRTAVSYDSKERSEPEIEMIFVYVEKLFVSLLELCPPTTPPIRFRRGKIALHVTCTMRVDSGNLSSPANLHALNC